MLGNVLLTQYRNEEALASYDKALAIQPDFAEALCNRGVSLQGLKRYDEALASYDKALAIKPDFAEALCNRGNVLKELKRYDEALASYDRAFAVKSDFAEALNNRGLVLQALKRYDEALASYDGALAIKPELAEALSSRGLALCELGRHDEALASCDKALAIKPDYAEALSNRGLALCELGRYDQALASYDKALAIKAGSAEVFSNRGVALKELKRYDEALVSYDRALAIKQDFPEALSNRGAALKELKRYDEALASYDKALAVRPDYAEALSNRGNALEELRRYDEALANYDKALAIKADFPEAHLNQSLCRLLVGDFENGWEQHEWRWLSKDCSSPKRGFLQPLWLGREDIAGKTILLHAEQGLGDTIQFARYTQSVARKGARVILEVHPPLRSLISGMPGAHQVVSRGEPLPGFDFHCPLMSLPLAFNTRLQTIPASIPYLRAADGAVKKWEGRLGGTNALRVGIVWSGRLAHKNDRNRSISLSRLARLANPNVTLVSLQNEVRAKDAEVLAANKQIRHFGSELKDFSDTAALASLMDLVISVDTSVAHLAGALGKPVWILLPFAADWRWLAGREDSPWYPTARLFRQPEMGDWDSVLESVIHGLRIYGARASDEGRID
jgi:tetratricopeptide (TPR) repeat protein